MNIENLGIKDPDFVELVVQISSAAAVSAIDLYNKRLIANRKI
jgi:hypothetical protein